MIRCLSASSQPRVSRRGSFADPVGLSGRNRGENPADNPGTNRGRNSENRSASLLAGTALALVLAAAVLTPQQAMAQQCVQAGGAGGAVWDCNGVDNDGAAVNADNANTIVNLGPTTAFDVSNAGGDAFVVTGNDNNINMVRNGVDNSYTSTSGDDAIDIDMGDGNLLVADGFGGPITANGDGEGIEVDSNTGSITITTVAADVISVQDGDGVDLESEGGNISFTSNSTITSSGGRGIDIETEEGGTVTVVTNALINSEQDAIRTEADSGATNITTNSTLTSAEGDGIDATAWQEGHINIAANQEITAGDNGIEAESDGGNIDITTATAGTINATNGQGIFAETEDSGTVTVNAAGNIISGGDGIHTEADNGATNITTSGTIQTATGDGIDATAWGQGEINIIANNAIQAGDNGIEAESDGGNINITTIAEGTINATSGRGIDAETEDDGTITVNAAGAITSQGDGIHTEADTGATNITAGAITTATGDGIDARAWGEGDITVTANGVIDTGDSGIVAQSDGGNVSVTNNALITSNGPVGIGAVTTGTGSVNVEVNAAIDPPVIGVLALAAFGPVNVDVNADVDGLAAGVIAANIGAPGTGDVTVNQAAETTISGGIIGIGAGSLLGNVIVDSQGDVNGGLIGIGAASLAGNVSVTNTGTVTNTNVLGTGILALSGQGNIDVNANNVDGGLFGIVAFSPGLIGGGTHVNVNATNADGTSQVNGGLVGIFAGSVFSDVSVNANNVTADSSIGTGIVATTFSGNVDVTASGLVDAGLVGIFAANVGIVDGHVNVASTGDIEAGVIGATGLSENSDVNVSVNNVTVGSAAGLFGAGAIAFSENGDATTTVTGKVVVAGIFSVGAVAASVLGDSTINVTETGDIDPLIGTVSFTVLGTSTTNNAGTIEGDLIGAVGISLANDVIVNNAVTGVITSPDGIGVFTLSGTTTTYNNDGLIEGGTAAIVAISDDGTTINNNAGGVIQNTAVLANGNPDPSAVAIVSISGDDSTVNNGGTIHGTVFFLGGNDDTFNNNAGGVWNTSGLNLFGFGNDVVNNAGTVVTAGAAAAPATTLNVTTFLGVNTWSNNGGLLRMADGKTNDITVVSGVFFSDAVWDGSFNPVTGTASRIASDVFLSYYGDPASTFPSTGIQADLLVVGNVGAPGDGITSGRTGIIVRDVNAGPGAYDPVGTPVVYVDGANGGSGFTDPSHFFIHPNSDNFDPRFGGVVDKGAFFYFLDTRESQLDDEDIVHVLRSAPDAELFQLPSLITGAQNIWWDTAGTWHQRMADLRNFLIHRPLVAAPAPVIKGDIKDRIVTKAPPMAAPAPVSVTPGLWLVASGSWSERDRESKFSVGNFTFKHDTGFDQKTYSLMGGLDAGGEGIWGPNDALMVGILGGYISSDLDFRAESASAKYSGGTVGGYATYINDRFFLDMIVKADLLDLELGGLGGHGKKVDATSIGAQAEAGYRYPWASTAFLEPLVSIGFVNTEIDNANLGGVPVKFEDGKSVRGSLGLRVGAGGALPNGLWYEASVTGRLWNEFDGDNKVKVTNPNPLVTLPNFVDDFGGAFGQVAVKLDLFNFGANWSGFIQGDYKFNSDYQSATGKIGARVQW